MLATPATNWTRLDNGVRVVTERVPGFGTAGISILVDAGPQDEMAGQSGLAHLCEHALFLGTPLRSSQELAKLIDAAGGSFGAFTAPDYTCFYAYVLGDYVSYALDLLGDILVASKYPEESLEREKEVISQEILGYQDSPEHILLQSNKGILWSGSSLSNSLLGSADSIRSLSRSDVIKFVSRQYTPDRIIVAVAGQLEHDSIVEQVQDALWTLRGQSAPREEKPIKLGRGVRVTTMPIAQSSFSVAVPVFEYGHKSRYALHVLCNLIGGGMSSRLYQCLREKHGLVYSVNASILAYRRAGMMAISGGTNPEHLVQTVELVLVELMRLGLWENPIGEEELWKSKMQVRSQSRMATDSISNRVSRVATQEFHFGERIEDADILEAIDAVTIEDIKTLASDVLLEGIKQLAISVVGPTESGSSEHNELLDLHESFVSVATGAM